MTPPNKTKTDDEILQDWLPVTNPKEYEQHLRLVAMARAAGRAEGAAEQRAKDAELGDQWMCPLGDSDEDCRCLPITVARGLAQAIREQEEKK